jgi:hypothetical protein
VRNLTETIKSTLLDRELPYFRNASGKAIPMMTFGSGDGGRSVDIPDGAACIIVYTCPVDENYCGVEYHGINGIIDSEDARNLEAQFMLEEAGPLACTHKGASFFEISNIADDDVLNMRVDADPQSQKNRCHSSRRHLHHQPRLHRRLVSRGVRSPHRLGRQPLSRRVPHALARFLCCKTAGALAGRHALNCLWPGST